MKTVSDHKLDRTHADDLIGQAILNAECDALNREKQEQAAIPIISAMSRLWGVPYEPDDPHNKDNVDFQLGYCRGLQGEPNEQHCAGITAEWKRRGEPETANDSFKDWKRGYWAGRFTAASRLK